MGLDFTIAATDIAASTAATAAVPSVSAIIPACNRRHTLTQAIESVFCQSFPVLELIVVDDGSTDGTSNWLQQQYPQIRLIRQSNRGVSHARNRAIEQARGDWIALLDSDDRWYPDKLQEQFAAIEKSPHLRICHCDEHWLRNGRRVNPGLRHRKSGGNQFAACLPLCCISPSAVLLHRTLLQEIGLFDESLPVCEDYDLWLRICAVEDVLYVDKALLEKTGGHADQLSRRHAGMDRFRLQALARLLRSDVLSEQQSRLARATFNDKLEIYCNGALKRDRYEEAEQLREQYRDLIK